MAPRRTSDLVMELMSAAGRGRAVGMGEDRGGRTSGSDREGCGFTGLDSGDVDLTAPIPNTSKIGVWRIDTERPLRADGPDGRPDRDGGGRAGEEQLIVRVPGADVGRLFTARLSYTRCSCTGGGRRCGALRCRRRRSPRARPRCRGRCFAPPGCSSASSSGSRCRSRRLAIAWRRCPSARYGGPSLRPGTRPCGCL